MMTLFRSAWMRLPVVSSARELHELRVEALRQLDERAMSDALVQ